MSQAVEFSDLMLARLNSIYAGRVKLLGVSRLSLYEYEGRYSLELAVGVRYGRFTVVLNDDFTLSTIKVNGYDREQ